MRRTGLVLVVALLLLALLAPSASGIKPVRVLLDGRDVSAQVAVSVRGAQPVAEVEDLAAALGYAATWTADARLLELDTGRELLTARRLLEAMRMNEGASRLVALVSRKPGEPTIEGPPEFDIIMTRALRLLRDRAPATYRDVCWALTSVKLVDGIEACARVLPESGAVEMGLAEWQRLARDLPPADLALDYAITLAHEATHAQVAMAGLNDILSADDEQALAFLVGYRVAELLGAPASWRTALLGHVREYLPRE